jgi:hypothetical protein
VKPIAAVLVTVLSSLGGIARAVQTEASVLATYDLRGVLPRWDAGASWAQSLLVPPVASPAQDLASVDDSLKYAELASFELVDLLRQVLGDDLRREGRELTADGPVLTVLGPASVHEQVRAVLETLSSALSGSAVVRVDVLTPAEGRGELGSAGVIPEQEAAERVARLVGEGAEHRSFSLEVSAGRTAVLDAHRSVPFLFDYDPAIGQVISILMPVMSETREGTRLVLRALAVPGGLSLTLVRVRSELLALASRELSLHALVNEGEGSGTQLLAGPGALQSPDVLASAFAFDTFLADGHALALTFEGSLSGAATRELVLVRRAGGALRSYVTRPIPGTNRTIVALDAELFRPGRLVIAADPWVDPVQGRQPSVVALFDGELSGFLLEWLKARFSVWRRFGPWILIVTDPAWDRDAAAQLEQLVSELRPATTLQTVAIELRAPGDAALRPVRIRAPLLEGASAGFVLARGRTAVLGYDVEVANGAAVPDPHVGSVFEGLALGLALQGKMLEARGMAQVLDADVTSFDPGYAVIGRIERPEPHVLRFDERVRLDDGRETSVRIGGSSERAGEAGLAVEIAVSDAQR